LTNMVTEIVLFASKGLEAGSYFQGSNRSFITSDSVLALVG
jgi:hypothetical protein